MYLNSEDGEKLQVSEWLISATMPEFSHLQTYGYFPAESAAPALDERLYHAWWGRPSGGRMVVLKGDSMATTSTHQLEQAAQGKELISYDEAMEKLSREERFRATVYSMNTLLVQKGIYSPEEFEFQFRQFAQKNLR
jgi:hypothetical protein